MNDIPHIALLIESSREYGRGLLRGISQFHKEHGPWSIFFEPRGLDERPPDWIKRWRGDGILARINSRPVADVLLATGIPVVDVRGAIEDLGIPFVGVDNRAIAKLGFDHLQQCGLHSFAFCGTPRGENPNQDRRCDAFVELARAADQPCEVFLGARKRRNKGDWEIEQDELGRWLKSLQRPTGLMCCHDDRGHQTLDACRRVGLRVPDEIAVVSVDNDVSLCNLCTPPLSSIDVNPGRVGYEAAALLMGLMDGAPPPAGPLYLGPPRGIVPRQSTDSMFIDDHDVATALRFVRDHACEGIQSDDVLAKVSCSRSTLERRMKASLGRTIKDEISRLRIERAKLLLQETDLPIATVTHRSGYSDAKYFCEVFRKAMGITASEYRKLYRH